MEEDKRPQWFKLWVNKYYDVLGLYDLEELEIVLSEDLDDFFNDVGRAFINSLLYCVEKDSPEAQKQFGLYSREGKALYSLLKRDIEQCYRDYDKRVTDGKKGGRPSKKIGGAND